MQTAPHPISVHTEDQPQDIGEPAGIRPTRRGGRQKVTPRDGGAFASVASRDRTLPSASVAECHQRKTPVRQAAGREVSAEAPDVDTVLSVVRPNDDVNQTVPAIVGLLLVSGAILGTLWLANRLSPRSFPADHGVTSESPKWIRCAAETIERQPAPFTTGDFLITQTGEITALVEGTYRTIEVTLVEGRLFYSWFREHRDAHLDCPATGSPYADR